LGIIIRFVIFGIVCYKCLQEIEIKVFPLHPRFLEDAEVDHQWCRSQYLTGSLFRKSRGEIFRCVTRLRGCAVNRAVRNINFNDNEKV
jgi:hypothetical protein